MIVLTPEKTKRRLSANLSAAMAAKDISLRGLAREIKESHSSLYTLVTGANDARISLVAKVAEHFGVSVDDLLLPTSKFLKKFKDSPR